MVQHLESELVLDDLERNVKENRAPVGSLKASSSSVTLHVAAS